MNVRGTIKPGEPEHEEYLRRLAREAGTPQYPTRGGTRMRGGKELCATKYRATLYLAWDVSRHRSFRTLAACESWLNRQYARYGRACIVTSVIRLVEATE